VADGERGRRRHTLIICLLNLHEVFLHASSEWCRGQEGPHMCFLQCRLNCGYTTR